MPGLPSSSHRCRPGGASVIFPVVGRDRVPPLVAKEHRVLFYHGNVFGTTPPMIQHRIRAISDLVTQSAKLQSQINIFEVALPESPTQPADFFPQGAPHQETGPGARLHEEVAVDLRMIRRPAREDMI